MVHFDRPGKGLSTISYEGSYSGSYENGDAMIIPSELLEGLFKLYEGA